MKNTKELEKKLKKLREKGNVLWEKRNLNCEKIDKIERELILSSGILKTLKFEVEFRFDADEQYFYRVLEAKSDEKGCEKFIKFMKDYDMIRNNQYVVQVTIDENVEIEGYLLDPHYKFSYFNIHGIFPSVIEFAKKQKLNVIFDEKKYKKMFENLTEKMEEIKQII